MPERVRITPFYYHDESFYVLTSHALSPDNQCNKYLHVAAAALAVLLVMVAAAMSVVGAVATGRGAVHGRRQIVQRLERGGFCEGERSVKGRGV